VSAPTSEPAGRCILCGDTRFDRDDGRWVCAACGWPLGEVPDHDLPRPVIEVVYYLRWAERIKIGTSRNPKQRLAAIRHEELLAFERGGRDLEQARHVQFAHVREGGEWFTATDELLAHIEAVAGGRPPWQAYARWISEAYRG
jgi:hypothetical protein